MHPYLYFNRHVAKSDRKILGTKFKKNEMSAVIKISWGTVVGISGPVFSSLV